MLRLFIILLGFALYIYFSYDQTKLTNIQLSFPHQWAFLFPISLILIEIALLYVMLKQQYRHIDINWLFSLNSVLVNIYLILLYIRIYPLLSQ